MSSPGGGLALPSTARDITQGKGTGPLQSTQQLSPAHPSRAAALGPHRTSSIQGVQLPEQFSLGIFDAVLCLTEEGACSAPASAALLGPGCC